MLDWLILIAYVLICCWFIHAAAIRYSTDRIGTRVNIGLALVAFICAMVKWRTMFL